MDNLEQIREYSIKLQKALATNFPSADDADAMAKAAGVKMERLEGGAAAERWHSIVIEAEKSLLLVSIVCAAYKQYPREFEYLLDECEALFPSDNPCDREVLALPQDTHPYRKKVQGSLSIMALLVSASVVAYWLLMPEKCDPNQLCILISPIVEPPVHGPITLKENLTKEIDAALNGKEYTIIEIESTIRSEVMDEMAQKGALLAFGGGAYDPNREGTVKVWHIWNEEFDSVNSSGVRPVRVLPSLDIALIAPPQFECQGCLDMSEDLDSHVQFVSLVAAGLHDYLHGNYQSAAEQFRNALNRVVEPQGAGLKQPDDTGDDIQQRRSLLYYYIGKSFALQGDYQSAISCLQSALVYTSENSDVGYLCEFNSPRSDSSVEFTLESLSRTVESYEEIDTGKTDPAILVSLAQTLLVSLSEHGPMHAGKALRVAQNVIDEQELAEGFNSSVEKRLFNSGLINELYAQTKTDEDKVRHYEEALNKYETLNRHPNNPYKYETLIRLGSTSRILGTLSSDISHFANAERYLQEAAKLRVNYIWAFSEQLLLYTEWSVSAKGNIQQAVRLQQEIARSAAVLDNNFPDHMYTSVTKEKACRLSNDKACSLAVIDNAAGRFADSGWLLSYANGVYLYWANGASPSERQEYLEKAVPIYNLATELRPKDPYLHRQMGEFYELLGQPEQAESYYKLERELSNLGNPSDSERDG